MNSSPLVSIIIPTYNRAHLIGETLESVYSQSYANWECIVVDDGSSDNTEEVVMDFVRKDQRFQFHHRPAHHRAGGNGARNYGFSLAKGEFVNWFDSDDLMCENHLSSHIEVHVESDTDCTISSAKVFIKSLSNITRDWSLIKEDKSIVDEMIACKVLWPINGVVWKNKTLGNKKLFEEKLTSSQEWLFHLEFILNGINYKYLNKSTQLIRQHEERIGKQRSENKSFSRFYSRSLVFELLKKKNKLNMFNSEVIVRDINSSLRECILMGYNRTESQILSFYFKNFFYFKNKLNILKILFIAYPFYKIFKKGEILFKC